MGTAVPETSRVILNQWQAQGLKFNWLGSPGGGHLGFDGEIEDYEIVEQPMPEGMTVDQVRAMWEQGLTLEFELEYPIAERTPVCGDFKWVDGCFRGDELVKRLRVTAQPIPEKLLQEPEHIFQQRESASFPPCTELPVEECVIGTDEPKWEASSPVAMHLELPEADPHGLDPHDPGAIPSASMAILKHWQSQGLKFFFDGNTWDTPNALIFDDPAERYSIPEQSIPEGLQAECLAQMLDKGLEVVELTREGSIVPYEYVDMTPGLPKRVLKISAQPIPEKLLVVPVTELPVEEKLVQDDPIAIWDKNLAEAKPLNNIFGVETDPHGLDPHDPGAKLDAGKNRLGLVLGGFARALEEVGKVGTYGAEKYSPNGWKKVEDGSERYEDAMMRHWFARYTTSEREHTTGLLHQAQVVWNALAVLENLIKTLGE